MRTLKEIEDRDSEFFTLVRRVLSNYQLIEFNLKEYLKYCYKFARESLAPNLEYNRKESNIEKMSLGRLIDETIVFSKDKFLIKNLRAAAPYRNQVAHSIINTIHKSGFNAETIDSKISELKHWELQTEHLVIMTIDMLEISQKPNTYEPFSSQ